MSGELSTTEKKQQKNGDWVNIYWYNTRKKTSVVDDIDEYKDFDKKFIESRDHFNKKTLYKDISLSNRSKYFNYYKILKNDIKPGKYFEESINPEILPTLQKMALITKKKKFKKPNLTVKF